MIPITDTTLDMFFKILMEKIDTLDEKFSNMFGSARDKKKSSWLNVSELQAYLPSHPKKQTIYSWTSTRKIPFHKKGRSIMFDKAEIDAWLQDSEHVQSIDEIEQEAQKFFNNKSKQH